MYSAKKQIIILTIFLFFQACRQSVNEKERLDLVNKDTIGLSKNVIIKGVTDDSKAFDYLNFINYSYFNGTNHDELYTENFGDTTRFSLESINQPQIIELFSFGDSINYNTRLFVIPGDTVSMSFKNGNINFNGKNANHYSFFKELDSTNTEWAKNKFKGNFKDYKNGCKSIYERRKLFLEEYISNNQVSPEFVEQIESELKFEYLYNLIAPRFIATESGLSANEQEFITLVNLFSDIEKDGFFNLKDYFGPITIEEFQKPELINNDYFKRCLISFIRYYFSNSDFVDYTKDDFVEEQEYIQNNLNGELKEYALTRLIYDYYKKGFGQGKIDNQFVVDFIRKQTNEISNPAYEEILHQIEEELGLIGYKLPEKVIDDRFVGLDGDTLTFANLLKKTTSKIKVLDFWANWCSPCILDEPDKVNHFRRVKVSIVN